MNYQNRIDNLNKQKRHILKEADKDLGNKIMKSAKNGRRRNNLISKITSLMYRIISRIEDWVKCDQEKIESQQRDIEVFLNNNK